MSTDMDAPEHALCSEALARAHDAGRDLRSDLRNAKARVAELEKHARRVVAQHFHAGTVGPTLSERISELANVIAFGATASVCTDLESRAAQPIGSGQPQEPRVGRPDNPAAGNGIGLPIGGADQPGASDGEGQRPDTAATRAGAGELAGTFSWGKCSHCLGPIVAGGEGFVTMHAESCPTRPDRVEQRTSEAAPSPFRFTQKVRLRTFPTGESAPKEHGPAIRFTVEADDSFPISPDSVSCLLGHFASRLLQPKGSVSVRSTVDPWPLPNEWQRSNEAVRECPDCNGRGSEPDGFQLSEKQCVRCAGSGRIPRTNEEVSAATDTKAASEYQSPAEVIPGVHCSNEPLPGHGCAVHFDDDCLICAQQRTGHPLSGAELAAKHGFKPHGRSREEAIAWSKLGPAEPYDGILAGRVPSESDALERYQKLAGRIWDLFPSDPLGDDPAHFWVERLEALVNKGLLVPQRSDYARPRVHSVAGESPDVARAMTLIELLDGWGQGLTEAYCDDHYDHDVQLLTNFLQLARAEGPRPETPVSPSAEKDQVRK